MTVTSYDCFDTLIGRLCYSGHNCFSIIEEYKNIKDFKNNRIKYEQKTLADTYVHLERLYGKKMGDIMEFELRLEYEFSFPIKKYLSQLKDENIIVSDMYLNETQIRSLLMKHKNVSNHIYASYAGKSSGKFWETNTSIKTHYGDNHKSDYVMPKRYNVNAYHVNDTQLNEIDNILMKVNPYVSYIYRATRLSIIPTNDIFMDIFIQYVLPLLIIICHAIESRSKINNFDKVVFLSRDGYWFYNMFKVLFKDKPNSINVSYTYFSRLSVKNNKSKTVSRLVNSCGKNTLFVDLQGTGNTFHSLHDSLPKSTYTLLFPNSKNLFKSLIFDSYVHMKDIIEDLLAAPHGSINLNLLNPEYDTLQFKSWFKVLKRFETYHKQISKFSKKIYDYDGKTDYGILICNLNASNNFKFASDHIRKYIHHVKDHNDTKCKTYPLNYFSQIQQDQYFVENICKFKPNGTFVEIGGYDGIVGSNTYFLEKYLNWDGIVVECNPFIVEKCRSNRNCIVVDKAIYEKSNEKIKFTIPCGKDIKDGIQQLCGLTNHIRENNFKDFKHSYAKTKEIYVDTKNINDLLKENNINVIDYMSIDIEGYELNVLKTIDFNVYKIMYIGVEHGNDTKYMTDIINFMKSVNYEVERVHKWDIEFYRINGYYDRNIRA